MGSERPRLLTTPEAARAIGVARGTLAAYARDGIVKPYLTLPGGQHRWLLDDLVRQIRALRERERPEDG